MRKFLTLLWLLFPVGVVYYHFNEGQAQLAREKARDHLVRIRELERAKEPDWPTVVEEYDKLAGELPTEERPTVRHQIRLAKAKARIEMLDVAGAITDPASQKEEMITVLRRWQQDDPASADAIVKEMKLDPQILGRLRLP